MTEKYVLLVALTFLVFSCTPLDDQNTDNNNNPDEDQYIDDPDALVTAFSFTDLTGVTARSTQTSNRITVTGLDGNTRTKAKVTSGAGYIILNSIPTGTQEQDVIEGDTIEISAQAPEFGGSSASTATIVLQIGQTSDTWTITSQSVSISYGSGLEYFNAPITTTTRQSSQFAVPIQPSSVLNVDYIGIGIYENPNGLYMEAMPQSLSIYSNNSGEPGSVLKTYTFADANYDYYFGGDYGSCFIPMDSKQVIGDGYSLSANTIYWIVMTWSSDTVPSIASNGGTSYPTAAGLSRKYYNSGWVDWDDSNISIDATDAVAVYVVDIP